MHMPGHKRRMGTVGDPFQIDITEIHGFDDLHHAQGLLLEAQRRAAALYGSEETYYLVNGSTAGILAAVSGCTSFGGMLLMARNSHQSAYHAAMLRGLRTRYLYPQSTGDLGINGEISVQDVEDALREDPDIQAVLITSPTYDGVTSDVATIARVVHRYGLPLILDEAHGAHFPFSAHFPAHGVACGADVVVNSLHKTLPSLTQTGLLHINGAYVNREAIRRYLDIYQTSSPSYVLMAGIDNCVEWIGGHREEFDRFWERLQTLRSGLRHMRRLRLLEIDGMDESKILISPRYCGINGAELARRLREKYHIEPEMACSSYVCLLTSVADDEKCLNRLLEALLEIDADMEPGEAAPERLPDTDEALRAQSHYTLWQASEREQEDCVLDACEGRISGDFITLYPPGIPAAAPGEILSGEILARVRQYLRSGLEVRGVEQDRVRVLKRE